MRISTDIFSNIQALVVGDVMLDRYWFGAVDRISPEAPVPVIAVNREEVRAGGAANVAHNLVSLGAKSRLLSVIGNDEEGKTLKNVVEQFGASSSLQVDDSVKTIVKLRMVAQNQQLLRADFEQPPSEEILAQCLDSYQKVLDQVDVVLLSDYGKGGLRHVAKMIELANDSGVPVVVDPKGTDYSRYKGATLITPNMKEFEAVAGVAESEKDFQNRAQKLRDELNLEYLLVTRSEKGMSLFKRDGNIHDSPARAREVYDVSGAGDTVISLFALALVTNLSDEEKLELANTVAGIVVGKLGTAVATIEEVMQKLELEHS